MSPKELYNAVLNRGNLKGCDIPANTLVDFILKVSLLQEEQKSLPFNKEPDKTAAYSCGNQKTIDWNKEINKKRLSTTCNTFFIDESTVRNVVEFAKQSASLGNHERLGRQVGVFNKEDFGIIKDDCIPLLQLQRQINALENKQSVQYSLYSDKYGGHAVVLYKLSDRFYLFDPNTGEDKEIEDSFTAAKHVMLTLNAYGTNYEFKNTYYNKFIRNIKNNYPKFTQESLGVRILKGMVFTLISPLLAAIAFILLV